MYKEWYKSERDFFRNLDQSLTFGVVIIIATIIIMTLIILFFASLFI